MPPRGAEGALDYGELALSPDGRWAAWVARSRDAERVLWLQSLGNEETRALAGTEGAEFPFWSPDGRSVGFFARGKLKRIETADRAPQEICAAAFPWGGSWGSNGWILFAGEEAGIDRVEERGGVPENVARPEGPAKQYRWPSWLPDGRHFLDLELDDRSPDASRIVLRALGSAAGRAILPAHSRAEYAPPGYIVHLRGQSLVAQPFDLDRLAPEGEPLLLAEPVREVQGHAAFSLSQSGLLAYQAAATLGAEAPAFTLVDWNRAPGMALQPNPR